MSGAALQVRDLYVTHPGPPPVRALDGLSLSVAPGECLGVMGESGAGKSTLARALLGLLPGSRVEGEIWLGDLELRSLGEKDWRAVRWRRISLALQSATALNPVLRIGDQVAEPLRVHLRMDARAASRRAEEILVEVGLGREAAGRYPGELSGGQRRLALLAMALVCDPEVIVLDEPTSGLDAVTTERVLHLLNRVRGEGAVTLLVLSHDPQALAALCDRVAVVYRGWLAELGPTRRVLEDPRSPYTWALLNSRPTLGTIKEIRGIRGEPPDRAEVARGCPFLERCTQAIETCAEGRPPLVAPEGEDGDRLVACGRRGLVTVLSALDLRKTYEVRSRSLGRDRIRAVDGISLEVRSGEVLGVVGPTGAGKSTLAMLLVRLIEPDGGTLLLEGRDLLAARGRELRAVRRRAQLVFQDPYDALSPRLTVAECVREPLDVQDVGEPHARDSIVRGVLAEVRLPTDPEFLHLYPHELSGGQAQRVVLARALVLEPKLLVADEPVAMLDPSEQARALQLLKALQVERGMAVVLVSHDLAVVLRVADRVVVIDQGRVVEEATGTRLLMSPRHPVTRALLAAAGRQALFTHGRQTQHMDPSDGLAAGGAITDATPDVTTDTKGVVVWTDAPS